MHALVDDDFGRLTVRRLRPWHRMLARGLAARLDRELADGARPEASAVLAARALALTPIVGFMRRRNVMTRPGPAAVCTGLLAAGLLAACTSPPSPSPGPPEHVTSGPTGTYLVAAGIHKIKHVIIVMQENRSFDSYFG